MTRDVSIIGGSVAGLFSACLIAKKGLNVKLYEARDRIVPPSRTLIVTRTMQDLLGPVGDTAVMNEIRRFELFADSRRACVGLRHPDLVIERAGLVRELALKAEHAGVEVIRGKRFSELKPGRKTLRFTVCSNGDHDIAHESADILIGADGIFSSVAQSAGWPEQPKIQLIQAVVELPEDLAPHTTRVWFLPDETPYFYWLIPQSPSEGVIGLIAPEEVPGEEMLVRFMERKRLVFSEFQNAYIPRYRGWIPNHKKIGENHVYLVGDAAGHVKVSTVGGIVTGFRGAFAVMEDISNNGSNRHSKYLHRELSYHRILRSVLNRFSQKDYVRLLDLLSPSTLLSLGSCTRDESGKLLRRILMKQPRLLLLALRALLVK
jgi:flavin-dependent dehydrogenase